MPVDRTYAVVLEPDAEGGFTVFIPAFPSIITQADTVDDAISRAREAIELTIEDMLHNQEPIPEPDINARIERVAVHVDAA